jgi:hypothetical protein
MKSSTGGKTTTPRPNYNEEDIGFHSGGGGGVDIEIPPNIFDENCKEKID